jgi:hypothetical protein
VVISEARFPDMDGFSLVERLMGLAPEPLAFVLLTGQSGLGDGPPCPGSTTSASSRPTRPNSSGCWTASDAIRPSR